MWGHDRVLDRFNDVLNPNQAFCSPLPSSVFLQRKCIQWPGMAPTIFFFCRLGKRLLATSTSLSFSRTFVWISKELWERTSHIQGFYTFNNSDDLYISMRDLLHHPKNYYSILKKGLKKPKDWKRGKVYKIPNLYSSGSLQVGCSGVLCHLRKFVRTL